MILVIILFSFQINNIQANEEILSLTPSLGYIQTNNEEINIISAAGLLSIGLSMKVAKAYLNKQFQNYKIILRMEAYCFLILEMQILQKL